MGSSRELGQRGGISSTTQLGSGPEACCWQRPTRKPAWQSVPYAANAIPDPSRVPTTRAPPGLRFQAGREGHFGTEHAAAYGQVVTR